jgi:hypothetical protein
MLLGIYDDLMFMAAAASASVRYKLMFTGEPLTPGGNPPVIQTKDLSSFTTALLPWTGLANDVAAGNELIVAVGSEINGSWPQGQFALAVSSNGGVSFTRFTHPQGGRSSFFAGSSIAFGRGLFVMATPDTSGYFTLYTSPNGQTWTQRSAPFVGSGAVKFVNGVFFVYGFDTVGNVAAYATSTDGVSFARRPDLWASAGGATANGSGAAPVYSVDFANGYWIIGSHPQNGNVEIAYSTDLANYTKQALPWGNNVSLTQGTAYVAGVTYFNGLYYASGGTGVAPYRQIATSLDLKSWATLATPINNGALGAPLNMGDRLAFFLSTGFPNDYVDVNSGVVTYHPGSIDFEAYQTTDGASFGQVALPGVLWKPTGVKLIQS